MSAASTTMILGYSLMVERITVRDCEVESQPVPHSLRDECHVGRGQGRKAQEREDGTAWGDRPAT